MNIDTAFALAAHQFDHGSYPATLADLTPRDLAKRQRITLPISP